MTQDSNSISSNAEIRKILDGLIPQSSPQEDLFKEDIEDRKQDRKLRKSYANKWFWVVLSQLLVVNVVFAIMAVRSGLDSWTLRIFLGATLAECFGVIVIITRYLFPRK